MVNSEMQNADGGMVRKLNLCTPQFQPTSSPDTALTVVPAFLSVLYN